MQLGQQFPLPRLGKLKFKNSRDLKTSHFGVGFECLDREMWDQEKAWPLIDQLGIKWARCQTGWARTEKECGIYDFAWLDYTVDKLLEHGVNPWLSVSFGNPLYTPEMKCIREEDGGTEIIKTPYHGVGFPPIHTEKERTAWKNYVHALAEHFKGRVAYYEVWNEPDLLSFWKCQPDAKEYAEFVKTTSRTIKAVDPEARIIGGAVAWGMTAWSLRWIEECFQAGMADYIDVLSYHGYKGVPERHSIQEITAFKRLLNRYKPGLPYWQGEAGMQSYVPQEAVGMAALSSMKSSESIQARMLLRRFLLEMNNGCAMTSWFHFSDFAHYATFKATFHYGLIHLEDGTPKQAFQAYRALATVLSDPVEPADGRTAVHMSPRANSDAAYDPRNTKAHTWQAGFIKNNIPIQAWWIPESVECEPEWQNAELNLYLESGLKLENPVLINPADGEVYQLEMKIDRRSCGESWMFDNPNSAGLMVFQVPLSNQPLLMTDRSLIELN